MPKPCGKMNLEKHLLELIRLASTDLPADVEARLKARYELEDNPSARLMMESILTNVDLARRRSLPICQDTGTPLFYIRHPAGVKRRDIREQVLGAVGEATRLGFLRPNAVHPLSGVNSGNNIGDDFFPYTSFEESEENSFTIDLVLKGGGSENVGAQYSLPDSRLGAGRDLEGVRRAVLDAVFQAQGKGCPPGVLGVAIGGDRSASYAASKKVFIRHLDEGNPDPTLASLERQLTDQANQLGIGPIGLGGRTTVLGVRITALYRLPASFFVSVSYMCWAYRRWRLQVEGKHAAFS